MSFCGILTGYTSCHRLSDQPLRLIEVKSRHAEARDVIVTKNEILASLNAPEAFHLALVAVSNGFAHQPVYVQRCFKRELGFAETAVVFNLSDLLLLRAKAAWTARLDNEQDRLI